MLEDKMNTIKNLNFVINKYDIIIGTTVKVKEFNTTFNTTTVELCAYVDILLDNGKEINACKIILREGETTYPSHFEEESANRTINELKEILCTKWILLKNDERMSIIHEKCVEFVYEYIRNELQNKENKKIDAILSSMNNDIKE